MKKLLILAVVVALALVLVVPAATAATTEKDNGVTVINETVLAAPGTSQATIGFVAAQYGPSPPPAPLLAHGKGIGPIAD